MIQKIDKIIVNFSDAEHGKQLSCLSTKHRKNVMKITGRYIDPDKIAEEQKYKFRKYYDRLQRWEKHDYSNWAGSGWWR